MASYDVEMNWEHAGYRCVVIKFNSPYLKHRCGYVGIPKSHPLHGVKYHQHSETLKGLYEKALNLPVGKKGVLPLFAHIKGDMSPDVVFDVHGSITYSSGDQGCPIEHDGLWWFGFDANHCDDNRNMGGRPIQYMIDECESLARQLKEVQDEKQ